MTDRLKGFVVTLEEDLREDDAQHICDAIAMVKGVLSVRPVVRTVDDLMNRERGSHRAAAEASRRSVQQEGDGGVSNVDAVRRENRALVFPPRCAAGCGRHLVDSDAGTVCNGCIEKFCNCAKEQLGPYRIHAPECGVVQKIEAANG